MVARYHTKMAPNLWCFYDCLTTSEICQITFKNILRSDKFYMFLHCTVYSNLDT